MIPDVTGMRMKDARRTLEAAGVDIESVETAQPPKGTGHPFPAGVETDVYVATAWETGPSSVRLRVVSVPVAGTAG